MKKKVTVPKKQKTLRKPAAQKPDAGSRSIAEQRKSISRPFADIVKEADGKKLVLHIGCGAPNKAKLHKTFQGPEWFEVRLDIDPNVKPDICADMNDMSMIPDGGVHAVWSSHNIEHLYPHEVEGAFREISRVIQDGGLFLVTMPDIQAVATYVANGTLEDPIYDSPAGPICPIDILYGFRTSMARGNLFMAHKTGFTADTLAKRFRDTGFCNIKIQRNWVDLWGVGYKYPVGHPNRLERVTIEMDERTKQLKPPPALPLNRSPHPGAFAPNMLTDELNIQPKNWKPLGLKKA